MSKRFNMEYVTVLPNSGGKKVIIDLTCSDDSVCLQNIEDCLNEHMPPLKKTVDDFLAMSDDELDAMIRKHRLTSSRYANYSGQCWDNLRPGIRNRGYKIDINDQLEEHCEFELWKKDGVVQVANVEESTTVTLARFICACYLYVMQEEGAE